jgi:phosphomannomutase
LKLLNRQGEFISAHEGEEILRISEEESFIYAELVNIGQYSQNDEMLSFHIRRILGLPLVDAEAISRANFKIVVDAVNSSGGIAIPSLLRALGVKEIICLNCTPTVILHIIPNFASTLGEISEAVKKHSAHLGIVVDPDVDRLAFVCENGEMFGEEYTHGGCSRLCSSAQRR